MAVKTKIKFKKIKEKKVNINIELKKTLKEKTTKKGERKYTKQGSILTDHSKMKMLS